MRRVVPLYVFLAVLAAAPCWRLDAQNVTASTGAHDPFVVTTWKTGQGLPQNWVECVVQTRDGYLWVGTRLGLARFDGTRFTLFDKTETPVLEQTFPKALLEDRDGVLWVGAKGGLVRMNGGKFVRFRSSDGLCHDEVSSLAPSRDGGLWIGTGGGVSYLKNGAFTNYVNATLDHKHVYSICEDRDGTVWVGFSMGLYQLDRKTGAFRRGWASAGKLPHLHYDIVTAIYQDRRGRIWFGTHHGLYRHAEGAITDFSGESELGGEIRAIFEDAQGRIWILATGELFEFDERGFRPAGLKEKIGDLRLQSGCVDREGNLWIGSAFGGLNRLQPRHLNVFSAKDGLSHNDVWSVAEARDGTVWIGTSDGVAHFKDGHFGKWRMPETRREWAMRSVIQDTAGGLWFGSAFAGTSHFQRTNDNWFELMGLPGRQTRVVFEDRSHNIWIGTRETLSQMLPKPVSVALEHQRLVNTHGETWIYTSNEVLRAFENKHWVYTRPSDRWEYHATNFLHHELHECPIEPYRLEFPRDNWATNMSRGRLSSYDVRAILQDRAGVLWFGTAGGGVNRLQNGEFSAFTTVNGLVSNQITALHEDGDGVLWIGTDGGLSRFTAGRFDSITVHNGLFDNLVNQILDDDLGNLWIGTKRGIYRVSRRELNEVADGLAQSVRCIVFGESEGMLSSETNSQGQPAGCKTRDGKLWFPTTHGVVVIDPSRVRMNDSPPPVIIEEIRTADAVVFKNDHPTKPRSADFAGASMIPARDSPIVLAPGSGRLLEIIYTANSLTAPDRVRFKYRLHGHDDAWVDARDRRVAHYTNLKPGHYEFRVMACNNHGLWNEAGAGIAFSVAPRFWERLWFQPLCWLLSVTFVGAIIFHLRRIQQAKAVEIERSRINRDLHDDLGAGLTRIQLLGQRICGEPDCAAAAAARIAEDSAAMMGKLDELLWVTNPRFDTLDSLTSHLRELAARLLSESSISMKLDFPTHVPPQPVSASLRRELCLILREALNNVLKHANASETQVQLRLRPREAEGSPKPDYFLELSIIDNGCGFDRGTPSNGQRFSGGNGLANLQARVNSVGGSLEIESAHGQGTRVTASVPLRG